MFLSASSQIAIRLSGKGIWFQTSANPIPHFIDLRGYCGVHAEKMKNVMGTKVNINAKANGKGRIEIEYYSEEELERLYDMIMSIHHQ